MNYKQNQTLWISHSAISDFGACPKLYYYKSLYRSSLTNNRIQVASPYLTLGSAVHQALEELSGLPPKERFKASLIKRFEKIWKETAGKKGGFVDLDQEEAFKKRGKKMLKKVQDNPHVIENPSYSSNGSFPKVKLFGDKEIVLVGNIDWVEILPSGGLHIIDFKTGKNEEKQGSLQLPIYLILATYNFERPIEKFSYWYLDKDDGPKTVELEPLQSYIPIIREKALSIEKAIEDGQFACQSNYRSCFKCREYDNVVRGSAEYVGYDGERGKDLFFVNKNKI